MECLRNQTANYVSKPHGSWPDRAMQGEIGLGQVIVAYHLVRPERAGGTISARLPVNIYTAGLLEASN